MLIDEIFRLSESFLGSLPIVGSLLTEPNSPLRTFMAPFRRKRKARLILDEEMQHTERCPRSTQLSTMGENIEHVLSTDILSEIVSFLDLQSLLRLSRCSKNMHAVCTQDDSIMRDHVVTRFALNPTLHAFRLKFESDNERTFRDLYKRLDSGATTFKGYAQDSTTSTAPYIMELIVRSSQKIHILSSKESSVVKKLDGVCRCSVPELSIDNLTKFSGCIIELEEEVSYPDLEAFHPTSKHERENSFTLSSLSSSSALQASNRKTMLEIKDSSTSEAVNKPNRSRFVNDRFLRSTRPRTIAIEETEILRGRPQVTIPNKYFGVIVGPVLLGIYDAEHNDSIGVFVLVMEEALEPLIGVPKAIQEQSCSTGIYCQVLSRDKIDNFYCCISWTSALNDLHESALTNQTPTALGQLKICPASKYWNDSNVGQSTHLQIPIEIFCLNSSSQSNSWEGKLMKSDAILSQNTTKHDAQRHASLQQLLSNLPTARFSLIRLGNILFGLLPERGVFYVLIE